jgi:hypothetical protein
MVRVATHPLAVGAGSVAFIGSAADGGATSRLLASILGRKPDNVRVRRRMDGGAGYVFARLSLVAMTV